MPPASVTRRPSTFFAHAATRELCVDRAASTACTITSGRERHDAATAAMRARPCCLEQLTADLAEAAPSQQGRPFVRNCGDAKFCTLDLPRPSPRHTRGTRR
jgi:hypothetical protein